jgi:hypothetical protein
VSDVVELPSVQNCRPRPEQDGKGRFIAGNSGNGGRPRGARSKLGEEFLTDLYEDFIEHGRAAIERVRQEEPTTYIRVIASLVPKELKIENSRFANMSEEEIDEALRRHVLLLQEVTGAQRIISLPYTSAARAGLGAEEAQRGNIGNERRQHREKTKA